jgi:prenyltransferase/squalene oxidase-like repeat protein
MADLDRYVESVHKGIAWLAAQQNADGSLGEAHQTPAMFFYKSANALGLAGRVEAAGQLLGWIAAHMLEPDGSLGAKAGGGAATYRISWILLGAHRLCRFDITAPFLDWLRARQLPCGGFAPNPDTDDTNTIFTWAGMAALQAGDLATAARAAAHVASIIDQQPLPARFYHSTTADGQLRTGDDPGLYVDMAAPAQGYYFLGIPMVLLARLHLATGDPLHLAGAKALYECTQRCASDAYSYTASAKSMVGAAILHRITGEDPMLESALCMADFLLGAQDPEGWWGLAGNCELGIRIDATAEFCIFLSDLVSTLAGTSGGDQ